MIAYGFPPEGNAGAYRPLRFVRQLPHLGWIPTVISAIPSQYERYDPALLKIVPNEIEVIRINANDLWQTFQAWRSRKSVSSSVQEESAGNQQNGEQRRFPSVAERNGRTCGGLAVLPRYGDAVD